MPLADRNDALPSGAPRESTPSGGTTETPSTAPAPVAPAAPGVLTTLLCERCGNEQLIRVKGCWYCEKCHYKFDCFGV